MIKKEDVYSTIAKRIREERRRLDWTQEELAEKVDVNPKFISRIENIKDKPGFEMVIKLANTLDVPLVSLFIDGKNKSNDLLNQINYIISDLNKEQQENIINILINTTKEIKKLIK